MAMADFELRTFMIIVPLSFTEIKYMHDNLKADCQNKDKLHLFINIAKAIPLPPINLFKQEHRMINVF